MLISCAVTVPLFSPMHVVDFLMRGLFFGYKDEKFSFDPSRIEVAQWNSLLLIAIWATIGPLSFPIEPRREKTGFLPMRKQRRRSTSQ